ncbi:MAG: helix-turn-helix transcriptional regulator [Peptostreptococcaceae bacterium]|nr:helix-turn-helix transcriptional regulator [Peptostreptococcaceae bacterium]
MTIGEKLRELRLSKNLKLANLAKVINRSYQAYSQYELDKRQPSIDMIIIISKFYGVSSDYLLGLTDDPTPYYLGKPKNLKELNVSGMAKDKIDLLVEITKIFKMI